jgi:beta-glucosidase
MTQLKLPSDSRLLQPDFVFGVATSSYQIEGAVSEGGRGVSIWDTFCHTPGAVDNNDHGDIACDHYHKWREDIEMIHSLGVDAYRLSIAWPRIMPTDGDVNPQGLAFYEGIIDACLAKGLAVYVTLYHWDLPQYLEDRGGWLNRETAVKFAEYADVVSRHFGEKIDVYTTLNEPFVSAFLGYRWGLHAPGVKGEKEGFLAAYNLLLAHGMAMPVLRRNAPGSKHGIVVNISPSYPQAPDDQGAAEYADLEGTSWFVDPLLKGEFPEAVVARLGPDAPDIYAADLALMAAPIDYMGVNYYTRTVIKTDSDGRPQSVPQPGAEHTDIGWEVYPQGLTELLLRLRRRYAALPPIYISENGAAYDDEIVDGVVNDQARVRYFQSHLLAVDDAVRQGVQVDGYFAWSLMDNFEWAYGYSKRFGIVYVDYATQIRTLKASAIALKELITADVRGKDNG